VRFVVYLLLLSGVARADEPTTLRIGTVIPDGTSWARELHAMGRDVDRATAGAVKMKWYMGGIAGDEREMLDRIRRGQLDGILSGGSACQTVAPSLQVTQIPGLLERWGEASYVLGELRPMLAAEAQRHGYTYLGEAIAGPSILFSKRPIASLDELRHSHVWLWDMDHVLRTLMPEMQIPTVPLPLADAAHAYDDGRVDVMVSPASVALGFQWSASSRYYTDVRFGFVVGCLLVANRSFDALALPLQDSLRVAGAKTKARFEEVGRTQEQALLGSLLRKQGLQPVPVSEAERGVFFDAERIARERAGSKLVPAALITRVLGILADYRSTH
jgi:TRAP-type C4-dicarboxylate transport system substrate-binding protein